MARWWRPRLERIALAVIAGTVGLTLVQLAQMLGPTGQ